MTKEESITTKIIKAFSNEETLPQHSVLIYQIDLYFPEHKLAIEVDEKGHTDRNINNEIERQKAIEEKIKCKFIRINHDAEIYDIFVEIGKTHNHIIESTKKLTKKSTKKSLFHKISKRLLKLDLNKSFNKI